MKKDCLTKTQNCYYVCKHVSLYIASNRNYVYNIYLIALTIIYSLELEKKCCVSDHSICWMLFTSV